MKNAKQPNKCDPNDGKCAPAITENSGEFTWDGQSMLPCAPNQLCEPHPDGQAPEGIYEYISPADQRLKNKSIDGDIIMETLNYLIRCFKNIKKKKTRIQDDGVAIRFEYKGKYHWIKIPYDRIKWIHGLHNKGIVVQKMMDKYLDDKYFEKITKYKKELDERSRKGNSSFHRKQRSDFGI